MYIQIKCETYVALVNYDDKWMFIFIDVEISIVNSST